MPLVSVIIPVRNGERYIRPAIESILSQTLTDLELLVVDDASTDNTPEIIQSYADPRVRLLRNQQRMGVSASRNCALAEAHAPYVAFLDAEALDLQDGEHLLLADSPDAFANAVLRILHDVALCTRLAEAGRQRVAQRYLWSSVRTRVAELVDGWLTAGRRKIA